MLDATPKPDGTDFTRMQVDDLDLVAVELAPRLSAIEPDFAGWDGRMTIDAAQPLIFNAWMPEFAHTLLFAQHVPESEWAAVAPWPDLVRSALGSGGNVLCGDRCEAMLRESHERAIAGLTRRFGADRAGWHWGNAHQVVFALPALRAIPGLGPLTEARIAESGDDSTVGRGGLRTDTLEAVHGAGYRGVYDLADLERSRFMVVPGQSGDPASRFARNFMREWRDGDTIVIRHQPGTTSAHIRLTP
jgi:penicillin amidase